MSTYSLNHLAPPSVNSALNSHLLTEGSSGARDQASRAWEPALSGDLSNHGGEPQYGERRWDREPRVRQHVTLDTKAGFGLANHSFLNIQYFIVHYPFYNITIHSGQSSGIIRCLNYLSLASKPPVSVSSSLDGQRLRLNSV